MNESSRQENRAVLGKIVSVIVLAIITSVIYERYSRITPGSNAHPVGDCYAFLNAESETEFRNASEVGDAYGRVELLDNQKAFELTSATSLLALETRIQWYGLFHPNMSALSRKVRILSGSSAGRIGWVNDDCLVLGAPVRSDH